MNADLEISPAIRCDIRSYRYPNGTLANEGIHLEIPAGECFCLLGPNGAGKTTFVRQLTTELAPTDGRISVLGRDLRHDRDAVGLMLGVVPQSASLFGGLTVERHLRFFGPIKGLSAAATRRRAERVLEECGLAELRDRRAGELSGGQARKLLLALALLADPPVLILDEPTIGLDPSARRAFWATLEEQKAAGKTIVLTTHYLDEAERLADRLGLMKSGRLERVGTVAQFLHALGASFRVTIVDPTNLRQREHHYFDSLDDASAFVREKGVLSYTLTPVSLEDVYLRLLDAAPEDPS
jgi:ABC-type multidrug transport system ATPase subunit